MLLAANLGLCCKQLSTPQKVLILPRAEVSQSSGFENNNCSLDDQVVNEAAQSVELVEASAGYRINYRGELYKGEMEKRGSAVLLGETGGKYYFLTAYHVVDLPGSFSSTVAFSKSSSGLESLLDWKLSPELANTLTFSHSVTATISGGRNLTIGGISGGEVVCEDGGLDYALVTVPSNGRLKPLANQARAFIGDPERLNTADYVYTIGYSLSLGRFVTEGIISNENLPLSTGGNFRFERSDAFTFTSPISRGNSGGPVFSIAEGKLHLIGIAIAYFEQGHNLNVAMKINDIFADIGRQGCLAAGNIKIELVNYFKGNEK